MRPDYCSPAYIYSKNTFLKKLLLSWRLVKLKVECRFQILVIIKNRVKIIQTRILKYKKIPFIYAMLIKQCTISLERKTLPFALRWTEYTLVV